MKQKCSIHLSNIHELYAPILGETRKEHLSGPDYKALFWPSNFPKRYFLRGSMPEFTQPAIQLFYLEEKLQNCKYYKEAIPFNHYSKVLRACEEIEIAPTVWSEVALNIKLAAERRGIQVRSAPSCSVEEIAVLNSRTGGYEFLSEFCGFANSLPETHIFFGLPQARSFVRTRSPDSNWVIKGEFGIGGAGVMEVQGGKELSSKRFLDTYEFSSPKKQKKFEMSKDDAVRQTILVQEKICAEPLGLTPSVTADFSIHEADKNSYSFQMHGFARQVFSDAGAYQGVSFRANAFEKSLSSEMNSFGETISSKLFQRGFRGFFNLDYLYHAGRKKLYLLELNLRASAPLDQFCAMQQIFGSQWYEQIDFDWSFMESARLPKSAKDILTTAEREVWSKKLPRVLPIAVPAARDTHWPVYTFSQTMEIST